MLAQLLEAEEVEAELSQPLDVSVQLRLVDDYAGQDCGALYPFHPHAVEEEREAVIDLSPNDDPVCRAHGASVTQK